MFTQTLSLLSQPREAVHFSTGDSESPSFFISPRRRFDDDVDQGPLAKRAWVLQERVLSPRTLHFTSRQMYWECWAFHQGEDLECTGLGVMKNEMFPLALRPTTVIEQQDLGRVPRFWWYLLSEYTSASLTYSADKLVAIDALIKRMEQRLAIRNLKGIWAEAWEIGILWAARDTGLEWNLETGAPSWSWASRTGPVNHFQVSQFYQHDQTHLQVGQELKLRARSYTLSSDVNIGDLLRSFPGAGPPELDYQSSRYRVIFAQDGAEVGWLAMDQEDNNPAFYSHCSWILVTSAADSDDESDVSDGQESLVCSEATKWKPHYCILVLDVGETRYMRVGAGTIYYSSCLHSTDRIIDIN